LTIFLALNLKGNSQSFINGGVGRNKKWGGVFLTISRFDNTLKGGFSF